MSLFSRGILLATDGSEEAEPTAGVAVELAKSTGAELHLVYVKLIPITPPYPEVLDWKEDLERADREARELLDEQVKMVEEDGGAVAGAHLRAEEPAEEIVALAEELGVGLIVVGSRGRGRIRRALMGSVSDWVVRHARCPVLVVGAGAQVADVVGKAVLTDLRRRVLNVNPCITLTDGDKPQTRARDNRERRPNGFTNLKDGAGRRPSGSPTRGAWKKECDVTTKFRGKQRGELATGVPERRSVPLRYVVVKDDDKGLGVLRVTLRGKGEALPVFSAGWAARGYLFAEAPGGGWYVRACTPDELVSLIVGPCAGVEWVALDPRPGPRSGSEVATVMPRENFVDYLLGLTRPLSYFDGATSRPPKVEPHGRRDDQ